METFKKITIHRSALRVSVAFLVVAFLAIFPSIAGHGMTSKFMFILEMVYLSVAWNIMGGYAGQFSMAHGALFGVGAYTSAVLYLNFGVSLWVGMFIGGAAATILMLAISYPCFNRGIAGFYFVMITLVFSEVIRTIMGSLGFLGGRVGMHLPLVDAPSQFLFLGDAIYYYVALVMTIAVIAISYAIRRSRFGDELLAIRENESLAQSVGIDVAKNKLVAAAISAFLTALAGTLIASYSHLIHPDYSASLLIGVQMLLASIAGGLGTLWGPVIGGIFIMGLSQLILMLPVTGSFGPAANAASYGAIIILVVLIFPKGIMGFLRRGR